MQRSRSCCGILLAIALFDSAILGQEPEKRDAIPRGFRMYLVADGRYAEDAKKKKDPDKKVSAKDDTIHYRVGKLHDPVTEHGLNTVIAVFVRGVPKDEADPAVKVLRAEQELAKKYRTQRVGAFMAFLALNKDFAEDDTRYERMKEIKSLTDAAMVPYVQTGLAEATLADGSVPPQVAAWGIGADDAISIVLYHRFKLVKRWQFKADAPPTDKELQELSDEVDVLMGKKKE